MPKKKTSMLLCVHKAHLVQRLCFSHPKLLPRTYSQWSIFRSRRPPLITMSVNTPSLDYLHLLSLNPIQGRVRAEGAGADPAVIRWGWGTAWKVHQLISDYLGRLQCDVCVTKYDQKFNTNPEVYVWSEPPSWTSVTSSILNKCTWRTVLWYYCSCGVVHQRRC